MTSVNPVPEAITVWLREHGYDSVQIIPLLGDASARRYYRVCREATSWILMVAPSKEVAEGRFFSLATHLRQIGLNAPAILLHDASLGFSLLSDLGASHYLDVLTAENASRLYGDAVHAIALMQQHPPAAIVLPSYDETLLCAEMDLFRHWLCEALLGLVLTPKERHTLAKCVKKLTASAINQPQVFVHRDYHSRNLMHSVAHNPGIVDFQDAVCGAITYDLVSLLKDCYISWPKSLLEEWLQGFHRQHWSEWDFAQFRQWFDWMGVQRHMKASGIFARLWLRDGKLGYLQEIPRTLTYITALNSVYPEIQWLGEFVERRIMPRLTERLR